MSQRVSCRYHPAAPLIEDHRAGDQICSECGLVVGDRVIDVGSEWRSFSDKGDGKVDQSRVGGAETPLLGSGGLTTMIGPGVIGHRGSYDGSGNSLYNNNRRTVSSSDRALINAFRTISEMADRISLPQTIIDRANNLFKMVTRGGT
jgi:transcription initiation factor TFIIB